MRRHPLAVGGAVLAAVLLVAVLAPPPALTSSATSPDMAVAPESTAASCTGWSSTYVPPPTIDVGMVDTSGDVSSVVQVSFLTYVQTVLAAEWGTANDSTYLEIGAMAVKQYGWYYAIHGRLNHTFKGQCFDVRSDTVDQLYDPVNRHPSAYDDAAVLATWQISMRKAGVFFLPHYNGSTKTACGAGGFTTGTLLPQQPIHTCITQGMDRNAILHLYLDPPNPPLSIDDLVDLAGGDRYATAVAISAWRFHPGVPAAVVASGANFPDALAGGPLAARLGAPILLLPPTDDIPAGVAAELQRLAPARIVVLGGEGVILRPRTPRLRPSSRVRTPPTSCASRERRDTTRRSPSRSSPSRHYSVLPPRHRTCLSSSWPTARRSLMPWPGLQPGRAWVDRC